MISKRQAPFPSFFKPAILTAAILILAACGDTKILSGPNVQPSTITLSASAKVSAAPDQAHTTTGVVTEAKTAQEAMSQQAARMTKVFAELEKAGIERKDITTSGLSLGPQYAYDQQTRKQRITGYSASNQVTVLARDLDKVGPMLDALVKAGANQISGVNFQVSNADELLDEARAEAAQKVRKRADLYAKALNAKVLRVTSLHEDRGWDGPRPVMARQMAAESADASTPISAGDVDLTANVTASFEIE